MCNNHYLELHIFVDLMSEIKLLSVQSFSRFKKTQTRTKNNTLVFIMYIPMQYLCFYTQFNSSFKGLKKDITRFPRKPQDWRLREITH